MIVDIDPSLKVLFLKKLNIFLKLKFQVVLITNPSAGETFASLIEKIKILADTLLSQS